MTTTAAEDRRAQQSDAIVEATLESLRKNGYAATSLQRIADEAGTSKRMVLHYFSTREELFETVVDRICHRMIEQVNQAVEAATDPSNALSDGLDKLWAEVIADSSTHTIFFGLMAESTADPVLREYLGNLRNELRAMLARMIEMSMPDDAHVHADRLEATAALILAVISGLALDFIERGHSPELDQTFAEFKRRLHLPLA